MAARTTLSRKVEPRSRDEARLEPHLFLVLGCTPVSSLPARCRLGSFGEVSIGRTDARAFMPEGPTLRIGLPDPWMSAAHVVLRKVLGSWCLQDAGSKNGTFVNGQPAGDRPLADGDVIEAGESFFLFRQCIAGAGEGPVVEASEGKDRAAVLTTMVPGLQAEYARVRAIAPSKVPVAISGESGTGKELVASAIHALSDRSGEFQAVNCAALPPTLVESELFGYRKGTFTGADEDRPGLVRAADRGTLFLDEIGDLPLPAQGALLRVLQESEVRPVGSTRPVKVDVRLVTATHRDLDVMAREQRFREDLLARIRGLSIRLPPLRERREDLGLLIRALLRCKAGRSASAASFTIDAARVLLAYRWPQNIRELERSLDAALVLAGEKPIALKHLPQELRAPQPAPVAPEAPLPEVLPDSDQRRREEIVAALLANSGNVTAAAKALGKHRQQVQRWIRRYGIDRTGTGR